MRQVRREIDELLAVISVRLVDDEVLHVEKHVAVLLRIRLVARVVSGLVDEHVDKPAAGEIRVGLLPAAALIQSV